MTCLELRTWMMAAVAVGWMASVGGCGGTASAADDFSDEMPEDLPAGKCAGSSSGTDGCETDGSSGDVVGSSGTTGAPEDACSSTEDCLGNEVCGALWDATSETRQGFACEFACIPELDENRWCSDDASCCDAAAQCTARGYCILPESSGSSGASSSGGDTDGEPE